MHLTYDHTLTHHRGPWDCGTPVNLWGPSQIRLKGCLASVSMLEELNETSFQMKDAMDVSFKELKLNMDNVLKSHLIYKNPSLTIVHTKTNKTTTK